MTEQELHEENEALREALLDLRAQIDETLASYTPEEPDDGEDEEDDESDDDEEDEDGDERDLRYEEEE